MLLLLGLLLPSAASADDGELFAAAAFGRLTPTLFPSAAVAAVVAAAAAGASALASSAAAVCGIFSVIFLLTFPLNQFKNDNNCNNSFI